jgi:hypothetical protein
MARQPWEIEEQPGGFRIRVIAATGVQQQPWDFIPCSAVKQVKGVYQPGIGVRQSNNIRKTPIREDDRILLIISFHDENNTSPLEYDILYVNNQPTWTPDLAGLTQAITDVSSWCGSSNSDIISVITGNTESPSTVENTSSGAVDSTNAGVKGFSILFEGSGGSLGGVPVISGYISSKAASLGNSLAAQAYVVPNAADATFPNSPRVVIEYVT